MAKRHPGVKYLRTDEKGQRWYRIRTKLTHPKTGRHHEIDRKVIAEDASAAAILLASERSAWLSKRTKAAASGPRRLGDAMGAWLAEKRSEVKPSTLSTYNTAVDKWRGVLGDYWLHEIEPADVRDVIAGWREGGDASETIAGRLRVLRTFARESKVPAICDGVRVKREVREDERIEDEGRGLSLDELRAFLAAGPRLRVDRNGKLIAAWRRAWALVELMAWTGLRFGEASALEWRDVDLGACTIRVRRAQWRGKVGHVKAKCSKRTTVIPAELAETLREHRRAMMAAQSTGCDSALVFPSRRTGGYVTNTHARKAILAVCAKAGIALDGRPAVHCLRHTLANTLRQATSEIVRRAMIGHADEESGERYSHVEMAERRAALGGVVRMIKGGE